MSEYNDSAAASQAAAELPDNEPEDTTKAETAREEQIRDMAKEDYAWASDGDINIDNNAAVSEGDDNGAYVAAWVWVSFTGTPLDKEEDDV